MVLSIRISVNFYVFITKKNADAEYVISYLTSVKVFFVILFIRFILIQPKFLENSFRLFTCAFL